MDKKITFNPETQRPVYEKRYKENGEEYLKVVDVIDIEEDLKEKQLEIQRIKEIFKQQETMKAEELIDDLTDEEYLQELRELQTTTTEIDTYEFLNKMTQIKELYNKMPEDVRIKYKDLSKFTKEYVPQLIETQAKKLDLINKQKQAKANTKTQEQVNAEIQAQIEELQNKLNKGDETNV